MEYVIQLILDTMYQYFFISLFFQNNLIILDMLQIQSVIEYKSLIMFSSTQKMYGIHLVNVLLSDYFEIQ